jgi:hypothetical protein
MSFLFDVQSFLCRECSEQARTWVPRLGENLWEIIQGDNVHWLGRSRALPEDHSIWNDWARAWFWNAYGKIIMRAENVCFLCFIDGFSCLYFLNLDPVNSRIGLAAYILSKITLVCFQVKICKYAPVIFTMYVCMWQIDSHWTDFHVIWCSGVHCNLSIRWVLVKVGEQ